MNESALYPGWETVRKIGSGSFGAVYEIARTLPNGKTEKAALKVISIPQNEGDVEELYSSGYDDASITAHFKSYLADIVNEYSLMAEIKGHTNVVYCDDIRYIQHDDGFGWDIFIKMELLTPLMKAKEPGAVEDTVKKLGADICSALVLCREKNIIHRDIKPQNIFVSEHGDYKLGDFGIAKTVEKTTGGTKIGTYGYMAPEVYNNQPYGAAADIYSLGLVMYWLLNEHRLPFLPMPPKVPTSTENEQARLRRFRGEPIPAPKNGSEALKRIVLKACAYDPKDRYHTADEMLEDLNALQGSPTAAPERTVPAVEAEAPEDTETETRGAFTVGTARTAAPAPDAEKTEGTVGIFDREPERAEVKPQKKTPGKTGKPGSKKLYAAILGGILVAAVAVLALTQGGKKTSQTAKASGKTGTVTTAATEPKTASIPFSTEIGSTVEFGHYEQDAVTSNGPEPIEWYVISKDEDTNMLLLLSKDGLDIAQYHSKDTGVSWENCDLRRWLNSENGFWGTAFSKEEKAIIGNTLCKMIVTDSDGVRSDAGEDTVDKVFLLSRDEFGEYGVLGHQSWKDLSLTVYASSHIFNKNEGKTVWLRTPKNDMDIVNLVNFSGPANYYNEAATSWQAVRPAVWVAADGAEAPTDAVAHRPRSFFLNISMDEFEEELAQLLEVASSWTRETAPQTLDEFPLCPKAITELYDIVKNAESEVKITEITLTDSRLEWKTNLLEQLTEAREEGYSTAYLLSWSDEKDAYDATFLDRDGTAEIASDTLKKSHDIDVGCFLSKDLDIWHEQVQVTYPIEDGHITEKPGSIFISMDNTDYRISWSLYDGEYNVEIYPSSGDSIHVTYDKTTGELLSVW